LPLEELNISIFSLHWHNQLLGSIKCNRRWLHSKEQIIINKMPLFSINLVFKKVLSSKFLRLTVLNQLNNNTFNIRQHIMTSRSTILFHLRSTSMRIKVRASSAKNHATFITLTRTQFNKRDLFRVTINNLRSTGGLTQLLLKTKKLWCKATIITFILKMMPVLGISTPVRREKSESLQSVK
jgi:hypothetical protein